MSWSQALLKLQDTEMELRTLTQKLAAINTALAEQTELLKAQQAAERSTRAARQCQKAQQDLEFELNQTQTKLKQTEQRLYSGTVTNSRELADLQAGAQSLQKRINKLEDDLLEAMSAREAADAATTLATAQLATVVEQTTRQNSSLLAEQAQHQTRSQALQAQIPGLQAQIPPTVLESYEYLKKRTDGIAVARVIGDVCSVCGVEMLKPVQRKLQHGEEAFCEGCRRLLVM